MKSTRCIFHYDGFCQKPDKNTNLTWKQNRREEFLSGRLKVFFEVYWMNCECLSEIHSLYFSLRWILCQEIVRSSNQKPDQNTNLTWKQNRREEFLSGCLKVFFEVYWMNCERLSENYSLYFSLRWILCQEIVRSVNQKPDKNTNLTWKQTRREEFLSERGKVFFEVH